MGLFDNFKKAEVRSLENPNTPVSAENFLHIMGWGDFQSSAGVTVNIDNALGVPAVWAAVNFISGTLASLPLEVYRGNQRVTDGIGAWLNRAINPTTSSFQWRKYSYEQTLTGGRSVTLILRNGRGDVTDLVPLDPADLHVQEVMTSEFPTKTYRSKSRVYQASEVIDLTFMQKHNQIDIRGPIMANKDIIGLAIASARYGSKAFQSGGIPPAVLQGPFQSGASAPSTTFANQLWYDTASNQIKKRNEANSAWVTLGTVDDSGGTFTPNGGLMPAGAVQTFAMSSAPTGWLSCDGSAVSRSTYSDLFSAISTTFGTGNGSTTFNVPDLRGEFIRGWDAGRGIDSGRSFGSAQADELKSHRHSIAFAGNGWDAYTG